MKLVTLAQMREIEKEAIEAGSSVEKLMETAGSGIAEFIEDNFEEGSRVITGLVGTGNNGGDTLVALAALAELGWQTQAILIGARGQNDSLVQRVTQAGGGILEANSRNWKEISVRLAESSILLDGILGAGVKLPLKPETAQALAQIKAMGICQLVIAVDCPSGVDMETGEAAPETIPADITLCMGAVKEGLLRFPAFSLAGMIDVVDLNLSPRLAAWKKLRGEVASLEIIAGMLPERRPDSHKGTFGTALIAAGSTNYTGAALLAAKSAYRVGTGLVRVAVPGPIHGAIAGTLPEATWLVLPHEQGVIHANAAAVLRDALGKVTAVLLGPGWGREDTTGEFLKEFLSSGQASPRKARIGFLEADQAASKGSAQLPPLVIDADGLFLLSKIDDWAKLLPKGAILTPHPGEMAVLTGSSVDEIQADRIGAATKFAGEWGQVVVLKGALTVIANPDGRYCIIPVASSALAKAGTGDVLAGMITGFRAQGLEAFDAAVCAAWIHAQAGLAAADTVGSEAAVLAGDIIDEIGAILMEID